nr:MAG TPA: hypothetical protein [Caudoviricetes sp.]
MISSKKGFVETMLSTPLFIFCNQKLPLPGRWEFFG